MKKIKILSAALFALFALTIMFTSCKKNEGTIAPQTEEPAIAAPDGNEFPSGESQKFGPPVVPPALEVPAGNCLMGGLYARGVQIYVDSLTATGTWAWILRAPQANLYLLPNFKIKVGTHYVGPTWANKFGGSVLGTRIASSPSPDPTAIPWLLIQKVSSTGPGLIPKTTYIQRINTTGGLAPSIVADAAHAGQVEAIPYTAEYYFYKAQ